MSHRKITMAINRIVNHRGMTEFRATAAYRNNGFRRQRSAKANTASMAAYIAKINLLGMLEAEAVDPELVREERAITVMPFGGVE